MKEFSLTCNKGEGKAIAFFLRQLMLRRVETWRPVAYKLNRALTTQLYSVDGNIVQSTVKLGVNLKSLRYKAKTECSSDLIAETYKLTAENNTLTVKDMIGGGSSIIPTEDNSIDKVVLSMLKGIVSDPSSDLELTVYFRKSSGKYLAKANKDFLMSKAVDVDDFKTLESLHSPVSKVKYTVEESNLDKDIVIFGIETYSDSVSSGNYATGCGEAAILKLVVEEAAQTLLSVKDSISD